MGLNFMRWLDDLEKRRLNPGRDGGLTVEDVDKLLAVAKAAYAFCKWTRDPRESSVRWDLRMAVKQLTGDYWELF